MSDDTSSPPQTNNTAVPTAPLATAEASSSASTNRQQSRFSSTSHWAQQVRKSQLSNMDPEWVKRREEASLRAEASRQQMLVASKAKSVEARSRKANTNMFKALKQDRDCSMMTSAAAPQQRSSGPGSSGASAPPPPQMMSVSRSEQAQVQMSIMEAEDEEVKRQAETEEGTMALWADDAMNNAMHERRRPMEEPAAHADDSGDDGSDGLLLRRSSRHPHRPQPFRPHIPVPVDPVPALDNEQQESLADLRVEPEDPDACAAKFAIYEAYSGKVEKIRSDLFEVAGEAVGKLPDVAQSALKRDLEKIDQPENTGIYDRSRYWFVHDMMEKAIENGLMMESISGSVASRIKMVQNEVQTECPVCLEKWDEEYVVPQMLGCCHSVCAACWDHWMAMCRPKDPFCPLCRHEEFVEVFAAMPPDDEEPDLEERGQERQ